ncbi:hypothetical protein [Glutamicibacter uratoxydans]|uniref:hypothetical protein n=1 Tax=Glutamicibacter uratoxydans TaxID=43667 RepID=UPI003D6F5FDC
MKKSFLKIAALTGIAAAVLAGAVVDNNADSEVNAGGLWPYSSVISVPAGGLWPY